MVLSMPRSKIITLCTDFGDRDNFVGQMKGAALAVDPDVKFVDLCHELPSHDIAAGAYVLETGYSAFPPGTIHVAVVDPGVGTSRRAIGAITEHHTFLAPDNGLLSRVLRREQRIRVHSLEATHYRRASGSTTFDGRDLFAPAAAWLCRGVDLAHFGPVVSDWVRLETRPALRSGHPCEAPVLVVDRFGNATVDVSASELSRLLGPGDGGDWQLSLRTPGGVVARVLRAYADGTDGAPFLIVNSAGYLEVAAFRQRAADLLDLRPGDAVEVTAG